MTERDQDGSPIEPFEIKNNRPNRDDTPTFIRDAQTRASMMPGHPTEIPVLEVPKSLKIWRMIRWPLLVTMVVTILTVVGVFTNNIIVAKSVLRTIEDAREAEKTGSVASIQAAYKMLSGLIDRHPDRKNAQSFWAWNLVLQTNLLGSNGNTKTTIEKAIKASGNHASAESDAAKAGLLVIDKNYAAAMLLIQKSLETYPGNPKIELTKAWALSGQGKHNDAAAALEESIKRSPDYIPLQVALVTTLLETNHNDKIAKAAKELLEKCPDHILGLLASLLVELPLWDDEKLNDEQINVFMHALSNVRPHLDTALPNMNWLRQYVIGRIHLLSGVPADAIDLFKQVLETRPNQEILAWYAKAKMSLEGPRAALALLDSHPKLGGPEIMDLRATCLLKYHRVDAASEIIEKMTQSGAYPKRVSQLSWPLAVRSGDIAGALKKMPKKISDEWLALELYHQLADAGDGDNIQKLASAFDSRLSGCASAIRAWHGKSPSKAHKLLNPSTKDTCVGALMWRTMGRRFDPTKIKESVERAVAAAPTDMRLAVDHAMVLRLVDGRDAAVKILENLWQQKPQGAPLRIAIGRAYIVMGLPKEALKILDGLEHPEAIALWIQATHESGDKKTAAKRLKNATAKKDIHPALLHLKLRNMAGSGRFEQLINEGEQSILTAGRYAGKIAILVAKAHNAIKEQREADRILEQTGRKVRRSSGLGISWDARIGQVRLNVRRGGKFIFKAIAIINELEDMGVHDPWLYYDFAMINDDQGNKKGAKVYLKAALKLDPSFLPAYRQLERMNELGTQFQAMMKLIRPNLK